MTCLQPRLYSPAGWWDVLFLSFPVLLIQKRIAGLWYWYWYQIKNIIKLEIGICSKTAIGSPQLS